MRGYDALSSSRKFWVYFLGITAIIWFILGSWTFGKACAKIGWDTAISNPKNEPILSAASAVWGAALSMSAAGLSGATYLLDEEPATLDYFLIAFVLPYGLTAVALAQLDENSNMSTFLAFAAGVLGTAALIVPLLASAKKSKNPTSKHGEDSEMAGVVTE